MNRLLLSLGLVVLGLTIGYLIQMAIAAGRLRPKRSVPVIRKTMQRFALLVISPITVIGSVWIAPIRYIEIISIPFLGAMALTLGGFIAYGFARVTHMSPKQLGAYTVCGGFSNLGSLGGLFLFILIGEEAFALVPFYTLFEKLLYFGIGFPIARSCSLSGTEDTKSQSVEPKQSRRRQLLASVLDPFVVITLVSVVIGLILNLLELPRPDFYTPLNAALVPFMSLVLLTSIGMAMRFGPMGKYVRPALVMVVIKALIVPVIITGLGYAIGLQHFADGLALKVVLILSAMPVGFTALVPPTIYELDLDLANTCWFFSNTALIGVVPLLGLLITLI